jgi:hypothetical protein
MWRRGVTADTASCRESEVPLAASLSGAIAIVDALPLAGLYEPAKGNSTIAQRVSSVCGSAPE